MSDKRLTVIDIVIVRGKKLVAVLRSLLLFFPVIFRDGGAKARGEVSFLLTNIDQWEGVLNVGQSGYLDKSLSQKSFAEDARNENPGRDPQD